MKMVPNPVYIFKTFGVITASPEIVIVPNGNAVDAIPIGP
jgi:hypothetical protein